MEITPAFLYQIIGELFVALKAQEQAIASIRAELPPKDN